ncbi:hypothetical protein HF326_03405 [Bacillus altitudinis MN12]|uniref:hypothetical protein n=1 Tax=Bacillus TaxID=1386 RepID=UPI000BFAA2F0|nr:MULTISPECIES: hypothetical protein [Bacillus]MBR0582086.1 hypothetical protein [Bacillus altitudinis MN12]MBR0594697.1 hypothetical protein [Bacillus altitudinis C16B11]MBR0610522.1 hypothetical protein [Bacillus altitudinis]MDI0274524.1 hypothetical protein [Bacillus safensis]PGD41948.1 hypothetical protein COM17_15145 [Bacillus altitudinis]
MSQNQFIQFQKSNGLDDEDVQFLITLSGAFCTCEEENKKAYDITRTAFIRHFGEELNLSDIEGNTREEYEKIIDQFLSKKDKKINVDELLQSFYAADMMDGLKKKFN